LPATDLYFPTPDMVHLPRWIAELRPELVNSDSLEADYLKIHPHRAPGSQAFLTIQTGCNKFCTYCVVPYARGLERNRPLADILNEARGLIAHGVIEITLLGQTVNSHPEFAKLLHEMNKLDGLEKLHWTAAHPLSMTDDVVAALALPKQVNYLHLPVQSGSTEVLRRMNRKYTREQFLDAINRIKAARPGIALGSDIIVGFPGETREQFNETLSLYEEVGFDISYNAQYSPRSGTLGVKLYKDDISKEEKRDRWDELQSLMEKIALEKNRQFIDRVVNVLVEKSDNGYASGNSHEMKLTRFKNDDTSLVAKIVPVKIKSVKSWVLEGERNDLQATV